MIDLSEKERRLAEWESTLTDMLFEGSRTAWRFFLLDDLNKMLTEKLIDVVEAKAMRDRVDSAFIAMTQA